MSIAKTTEDYLTFNLANQIFGVSVLQVNDVLGQQRMTQTPLFPQTIAGVMNLRGRIVTAIDVRRCLCQEQRPVGSASMSVVIEQNNELFSLIIDTVGDVLEINKDQLEAVPVTMDAVWRSVASGIHKLDGKLLVILDVRKLLDMARSHAGQKIE